jgi:transcriptional regulator with XRE-family HTH domain
MVSRTTIQRQRIGPAIRRLRRMNELTLDDLASRAGISASHLSRLERGQTLPSFQVLSEIAHVLGEDVDHFVQLESEVTTLDTEFRDLLQSHGFSEDLQNELMSTSIELRQALFDTFKQFGPPERRATVAPRPRTPRNGRTSRASRGAGTSD